MSSLLEEAAIKYDSIPLRNPTSEQIRNGLAASAASFALSSSPEVIAKPELSQAEKVALFAKWITALRDDAATDTPPSLVNEHQLAQDMFDLAA